jgi:F420-non-reducing hydrogenase iron-sulfur subunit
MSTSQVKLEWKPKIVAFLCKWCLYSRLDRADIARVQEQPNVRIIQIPCLGRMDPVHVLMSLQEGIDGVLVAGCHPGDCHYKRGNFMAENKMAVLQRVLEASGERGRVKFAHVSTADRGKLPRLIAELTEEIKALGPIDGRNQAQMKTLPTDHGLPATLPDGVD